MRSIDLSRAVDAFVAPRPGNAVSPSTKSDSAVLYPLSDQSNAAQDDSQQSSFASSLLNE
jgi:hypothetical protein